MKHIIIFSAIFLYFIKVFAAEVIYDIHHYPQKLHIILQFNGNENGITNINIPTNI